MTRRTLAALGIGAFALLLIYLTFRSTSTPLHRPAEDRELAQETCWASVRAELPDARFPFGATIREVGEGGLHLSGSVDAGPADQPVRRNYDCFLQADPTGGYVADSASVWQSH